LTESTVDQKVDVAKVYPGPVLLVAGPGTGKTHQLARRIKFLIEEKDVSPNDITVITFTGEAARNMRQRLCNEKILEVYIPPDKQPVHIRTMHSLGHMIINDAYRKLGLRKGFRVLTGKIRDILLDDASRTLGLAADDAGPTEECRRQGRCEETDENKCSICKQYQRLLRGLNTIDYDDQILIACRLLNEIPDLLSKWQQSTRHLLVDEYQDINQAQYKFIRLLCQNQEGGLFVVGDDDQSIYSWRGGSPNFIVNFEDHFGRKAQIYSLNECRRCPPHVLDAALAVVAKGNANRLPKNGLRSIRKDKPGKVVVSEVPSDKYEANTICSLIAAAPMTHDALVLVPGHRFSVPVKREMRKRRIAYECKTNVADSGLNSINDLIKWLKNERDNFSLRICLERIVSNPDLKIPFEKLDSIKEKREHTLNKIASLWPKVISEKTTLYNLLSTEIDSDAAMKFIMNLLVEIKNAWENRSNTSKFMETVTRIIRPWTSTTNMSDEIQDWAEDAFARNATSGEAVARILTMESAKGLGADLVFVVGLNKDVFPPDGTEGDALLEKQRLFYVSMTRAKGELGLFCARTREGRFSFQPAPDGREKGLLEPSPFLKLLPEEHVEIQKKWPHR